MAEHHTDIIIIGAGIAGLWTLKTLTEKGYNVLLLENNAIGSGQTIASQGIIHSGLKYRLGGKAGTISKNMAAMPRRWKSALGQECINAPSQTLFIPKGFMGGIVKTLAQKTLASDVRELNEKTWPDEIRSSGFTGSIIELDEPVLDIKSVLHKLAMPLQNQIRKNEQPIQFLKNSNNLIKSIEISGHQIVTKAIIFTSAKSNHAFAARLGHDAGLETQERPLLMGMMKNAPFPLYAHFLGKSDKPAATITTHKTFDDKLIWYIGGAVAERSKDSPALDTIDAAKIIFQKYLKHVDLSAAEWSAFPIDRIEGKSASWIPDTPTIHQFHNVFYAWPTKLSFAPLLAEMLLNRVQKENITPSGKKSNWSFLTLAPLAQPPWDRATWKRQN